MERTKDKSPKRSRIIRLAAVAVAAAAIAAAIFVFARFTANTDVRNGCDLLKQKKYGEAADAFRKKLKSDRFHTQTRGLLLYALAMKKHARRPIQELAGVDSAGLLRIVAEKQLFDAISSGGGDPANRDLTDKLDKYAYKIRDSLEENGVETKDWKDTAGVLASLAEAVFTYTGDDQRDETTRELLDFASVTIARRDAGSPLGEKAIDYIVSRLSGKDGPPPEICQIHDKKFLDALDTVAAGDNPTARENAINALFKLRLYQSLEWLWKKNKENNIVTSATSGLDPIYDKYSLFDQENKPFDELAGFDMDPTKLFWKTNFSSDGVPIPGETFAWVYAGVKDSNDFVNAFFIYTKNNTWEPLFKQAIALSPWIRTTGPAIEFVYCGNSSELALNDPSRFDSKTGNPTDWHDVWYPYRVDKENKFLYEGTSRAFACPY